MKNILSAGKIVLFINMLGAFFAQNTVFSGAFDLGQDGVPQKVRVIQYCLNSYQSADKEKQSIDLEIDIAGHHIGLTDASYLVYPVTPYVAVAIPQAIKQDFKLWLGYKDNPAMLMALLSNWQLYPYIGHDGSNIVSVLYNAITHRLIYFSGWAGIGDR